MEAEAASRFGSKPVRGSELAGTIIREAIQRAASCVIEKQVRVSAKFEIQKPLRLRSITQAGQDQALKGIGTDSATRTR